jgi:hypothetical protein
MNADDASSAEMRRQHPDPLALAEETVERLVTGRLSPAHAPPGYAEVAALLAAAAAPPTPEELDGKAAALAELKAVTRARGPGSQRAAKPASRRVGLAAVVLVGVLVTGGVAAAASGRLPGPVREAARSILETVGGAEPNRPAGPAPASGASTQGHVGPGQHTGPTDATGPIPGMTGTSVAPNPNLEGLCNAYRSGNGADQGGKLDSAAFQTLVRAAGSKEQVAGYCQDLVAGDSESKKDKEHKEKGPTPPDDLGQGHSQGQDGPPPSHAGGSGHSQGGERTDNERS